VPAKAILERAGFTSIHIRDSTDTFGHGVYNLWATRG
jgi:hypothetical protein